MAQYVAEFLKSSLQNTSSACFHNRAMLTVTIPTFRVWQVVVEFEFAVKALRPMVLALMVASLMVL